MIIKPERKKPQRSDAMYILVAALIMFGITKSVEGKLAEISSQVAIIKVKEVSAQTISGPTPVVIYKERIDDRVNRLQEFLETKQSPLAPYAEHIIRTSDRYGIDWTLIVAISGKESAYGKKSRCYNAWGLGGTHFMCFNSWKKSIEYMGQLLSDDYRHNMIAGIQPKYCPSEECDSNWTANIVEFTQEILAKGGENK